MAATDTSGSLTTDTGSFGLGAYGGMMAGFDDIKVSSPWRFRRSGCHLQNAGIGLHVLLHMQGQRSG